MVPVKPFVDVTKLFRLFMSSFYAQMIALFPAVLLGRLPKVDLIILEGGGGNVRPSVRPYVRTSVRPQKVSSISMKFGL